MSFEHFERGYLLPKGCKDLIDVTKPHAKMFLKAASPQPPTLKGDILVSEPTTVRQLAILLGQKPFKIIADAMEFGIFCQCKPASGFRGDLTDCREVWIYSEEDGITKRMQWTRR